MSQKEKFIHALGQTHKEHFAMTCKGADVILAIGTLPSRNDAALAQEIEACVDLGSKLIYLFTMEDPKLSSKSAFFSRYEVGSEEGVFALLAKSFLLHVKLPEPLKTYFEELDEGYVSAESNIGEEEIEEIEAICSNATKILLVLGEDLMSHPCAIQIANFAGLIANHASNVSLYVVGARQDDLRTATPNEIMHEIDNIPSFDGVVVYQCPVVQDTEAQLLMGSPQFQMAARVQNNETINVTINQEVYPRTFVRDDSLKGVIALMPCDKASAVYPYHVAKIVKAEQ